MAVRRWHGPPSRGEEATWPKWKASIDGIGTGKSAAFGALLSGANKPEEPALTAATSASFAQAGLSAGQNGIAVTVFVVIGSLSVAGPVLSFLAAPEKAGPSLVGIKEFMSQHNADHPLAVGSELVEASVVRAWERQVSVGRFPIRVKALQARRPTPPIRVRIPHPAAARL